jgi:RyR domain
MAYTPQPVETSSAELSPDILELTEQLARNAHEVWARERIAQGWRFGKERNDARKEHPCLVPYEQLPESEKVYDRNAALETLKAIQALGYRIVKP